MKNRIPLLLLAALGAGAAHAQSGAATGIDLAWSQSVEALSQQSARAAMGPRKDMRIEVEAGALDPRLKLAPCRQVEPYLPPGQPAWGRIRVGLRCTDGVVAWNVYLPVTVKVFAPALVASQPLPAGTVLQAEHLGLAETDWAAASTPPVAGAALVVGRVLSRTLAAGSALREADLKKRQWFAIGDPVRVIAAGPGFSVSADGLALTPGVEGQPARVRTESGRTVTGVAVGDRRIEVSL